MAPAASRKKKSSSKTASAPLAPSVLNTTSPPSSTIIQSNSPTFIQYMPPPLQTPPYPYATSSQAASFPTPNHSHHSDLNLVVTAPTGNIRRSSRVAAEEYNRQAMPQVASLTPLSRKRSSVQISEDLMVSTNPMAPALPKPKRKKKAPVSPKSQL
jgi:hypothetical protein